MTLTFIQCCVIPLQEHVIVRKGLKYFWWHNHLSPSKCKSDAVITGTKISGDIRIKCHGLFSMGQSVPGWNGVYINVQLPIRSNLQLEDFRYVDL